MNLIILIIIGVVSRMVPHLPNLTAVGAIALLTGAKLGMKKGIVTVFATMLLTDIILGLHPVMWATYSALIIPILSGVIIRRNQKAGMITGAAFVSSVFFYLITNFAVWITPNTMYPKTLSGLVDCYIMALPFFRNSLLGDISYTMIFFSAWALSKKGAVPFIRGTIHS